MAPKELRTTNILTHRINCHFATKSISILYIQNLCLGFTPHLRHIPGISIEGTDLVHSYYLYVPKHHDISTLLTVQIQTTMPLCTIHLLALHNSTPNPLSTFVSTLRSSNVSPLVVSRVIRWVILPSHLSTEHLLARNISWDVFLVLPNTSPLPADLEKLVHYHWSITAGVPSRLVQDFEQKNDKLLHPDPASVPKLSHAPLKTTTSSQNLELSEGLEAWVQDFIKEGGRASQGAVSMFNLLAFKPDMKPEYLKYGAAFAKSIGSRHGGNAKIVGNVVTNASSNDAGSDGWDEVALAHYPSIRHFRDMLVSEDYQEVNHKHRVGSLKDTCILMTSEIAIEEVLKGGGAKL
jgi:hypothetical protein